MAGEKIDIQKVLAELQRKWAHELAGALESGFDFQELDLETRKKIWPQIIRMSLGAGVDHDTMQSIIGASPSTIERWLIEGIMPKSVTQKLMASALAEYMAAT